MQLSRIERLRHFAFLAAASLPLAPAAAEEPADIVVTAGRTVVSSDDLGVAVIDRDEIALIQPDSGVDLLDRLAGVRAFSKGGAGGATYLSIRGGEPNFTLVLLDGIKVNDPTNSRGGAFDFAQIDPDALDRIEVARGGLSAVHGADALSGVVGLQPRRLEADTRLGSARTAIDSQGGLVASGTLGTGWSGGSTLASGSWRDSGDLTEGSDLERAQGFARAGQAFGAAIVSGFALHSHSRRSLFPEDSGGPMRAVNRERERRETNLTLLNLQGTASAGNWQPRLSLSWMRQDDEARTPAIAAGPVLDGVPAIAADSRFERVEATFDHRLRLGAAADVAFGGGYLDESGRSVGTIDIGFPLPADFKIERSVVSAFAEATVRPLGGVSATAALRYDDASTAAPEISGRAALRWQPSGPGFTLFGSWAEGYKLPSLYALAYPIIANPDLRPERSRSFDLGAERRWQGGVARISYFHSRYTDLIDFDAELFINVNRSRVTAQGVEAEVEARLGRSLALAANLTYLDTDQPADVPPLRSRPEWQGHAALRWTPSREIEAEFSGGYTDDFFDSSVPTGLVTLNSRFVASASLAYRIAPAATVTLSAHNLLAADYEDAVGFPAPGRVVRLGLRLHPLS